MIGGSEGQLALKAISARGVSQGAFGGDMDTVRIKGIEHVLDPRRGPDGKLDRRVGGAGDGLEWIRREKEHLMPEGFKLLSGFIQRGDYAIELGIPGIGGNRDPRHS